MQGFGIDADAAQAWLDGAAAGQDKVFGIWVDNVPAFSLFLDLRTQWRISPFGRALGLDYTALQATFDLRGVKRKRRGPLFDQVRTLETAALSVLNAA